MLTLCIAHGRFPLPTFIILDDSGSKASDISLEPPWLSAIANQSYVTELPKWFLNSIGQKPTSQQARHILEGKSGLLLCRNTEIPANPMFVAGVDTEDKPLRLACTRNIGFLGEPNGSDPLDPI